MSKDVSVRDKTTGEILFATGEKNKGFVQVRNDTTIKYVAEKNIEYLPDYEPAEPAITVIPAIERLSEYTRDYNKLMDQHAHIRSMLTCVSGLGKELFDEAVVDFNKKWGVDLVIKGPVSYDPNHHT